MRPTALLMERPAADVVDVLRALDRAGLLVAPPPWGDLDALLRAPPSVDDEEHYVYARLVAPADLPAPLRDEAAKALGELARAADARAPFDPFELVVVVPGDRSGARRAKRFKGRAGDAIAGLPEGVLRLHDARTPTSFALNDVAELRVPAEAVPYVAFALAKAGALQGRPLYLVDLDDE